MTAAKTNNVVIVPPAVMPEARQVVTMQQRARQEAEHAIAVRHLVDEHLVRLLEMSTGLDLHAQAYRFDVDNGYLIPQVDETPDSASVAPIATVAPAEAPIKLDERRRGRSKK